jgi:hypothetical protein
LLNAAFAMAVLDLISQVNKPEFHTQKKNLFIKHRGFFPFIKRTERQKYVWKQVKTY